MFLCNSCSWLVRDIILHSHFACTELTSFLVASAFLQIIKSCFLNGVQWNRGHQGQMYAWDLEKSQGNQLQFSSASSMSNIKPWIYSLLIHMVQNSGQIHKFSIFFFFFFQNNLCTTVSAPNLAMILQEQLLMYFSNCFCK